MGCDIHIYVEVQENAHWQKIGPFWDHPHYKPDVAPTTWNDRLTNQPFHGRNYNLFAILADVRNGYGFAGVDTGDRMEPLSEPRGLPDDVHYSIKEDSDGWAGDGHSHSFFTLKELIDGRRNFVKHTRGWVDSQEYAVFKKTGKPNGWSGGISGSMVKHVSNEEMDAVIVSGDDDGHTYTQVSFDIDETPSYDELVANLSLLLKYVDDDSERIRTVFWFDN